LLKAGERDGQQWWPPASITFLEHHHEPRRDSAVCVGLTVNLRCNEPALLRVPAMRVRSRSREPNETIRQDQALRSGLPQKSPCWPEHLMPYASMTCRASLREGRRSAHSSPTCHNIPRRRRIERIRFAHQAPPRTSPNADDACASPEGKVCEKTHSHPFSERPIRPAQGEWRAAYSVQAATSDHRAHPPADARSRRSVRRDVGFPANPRAQFRAT